MFLQEQAQTTAAFRQEQAQRTAAWELAYVSRQLKELYGPLYFQVVEGRAVWNHFAETFKGQYGRATPFFLLTPQQSSPSGAAPAPPYKTLTDAEWKTWIEWSEAEFLPRNRVIEQLPRDKAELIQGDSMPECYEQLLQHYAEWEANYRRWQATHSQSSWRPGINWPQCFEDRIRGTFTKLKLRQAELAGSSGK